MFCRIDIFSDLKNVFHLKIFQLGFNSIIKARYCWGIHRSIISKYRHLNEEQSMRSHVVLQHRISVFACEEIWSYSRIFYGRSLLSSFSFVSYVSQHANVIWIGRMPDSITLKLKIKNVQSAQHSPYRWSISPRPSCFLCNYL